MDLTFKYGELKKLIAESSKEYPVIGPNVESEDKKNNGKAYDEAKKRAKDYDGGLSKEIGEDKPKYEKRADDNWTTLDVQPDNASTEYKKRVKAQVHGYTSELEEKNDIEKSGDYEGNKTIYDAFKKRGEELQQGKATGKFIGLTANKCPKSTFEHENVYVNESKEGMDMRQMIDALKSKSETPKTVLKENHPMKTIIFKKTNFLTEGHMKSRIPDEFKNEGNIFRMKDKKGEEYIVEWKEGKANTISHCYESGYNDEMNHIKNLYEYNYKESNTDKKCRAEEGEKTLKEMIDLTRKIS